MIIDITEDDIIAAEVLTKYPGNLWFEKNEDELGRRGIYLQENLL